MGTSGVRRGNSEEAERLRSAGGVVLREQERGSPREAGYDVAVMRSRYGTWVFPKGGINAGETPEQAARRELHEEVGLGGLTVLSPLVSTEHEYRAEGRRFHKQVDWFLFLAPPEAELAPNAAEHALDAAWFDPKTALALLSHGNQRNLLRRALKRLHSKPSEP